MYLGTVMYSELPLPPTVAMPDVYYQSIDAPSSPPIVSPPQPVNMVAVGIVALLAALSLFN